MTPITTNDALADFCKAVASAPFIAVDTEFMRETTYWPKLCLIQAATPTHEAIIDPLAEDLDLTPFLDILRDPAVVKVFHAARQDTEIFVKLGAMPKPMFDSQVAAMAAGFGDQVSYDSLVRQMLKVDLDKGSRFTDWSRRPLSDAQLTYAIGDVTHLAALYPKLRDRLAKEGRLDWVTSEMEDLVDPDLYDTTPDRAWKRLKPKKFNAKYLAAFKAVAVWREQAAQDRDQPRGRILKDDAIDEIATQAPLDIEAFNRLRSVPKGFGGSRLGLELIEELKRVMADPEAHAPKMDRPAHNASAPPSVVELLKVLLKAKSDNAGVASKLIANVSDLEKIALSDSADVDALKGWRRQLFGEDALKLKKGEIALILNGARVEVVEIE
ncbi:MAG: ribonuclease [Brevundimonas sp.]|jgi:ribonuclease D|nr:ribonuclease [Brevundimonas sp.]